MHDRKIMEIQQKYQEDLEDIGQAHASAASQPDIDVIIEEEARKDRAVALKRGKDAMQRLKEAKQVTQSGNLYILFIVFLMHNGCMYVYVILFLEG